MRNLFKKSLAFCLVAALALTCFVGTFSVSAATFNATISVDNQTITQGTTSVPVVLNITSSEAGINEALIKVSSTLGTVTDVALDLDASVATIQYPEGATDKGAFFLSATNVPDGDTTALGSIAAASITVTFEVAADVAVGDYTIAIDTEGVKAASAAEDVINFAYTPATITVAAAGPAEPELDEAITAIVGAGLDDTVYMSFRINKALLDKYASFRLAINRKTKDDNWNLVDAETYYINKSQLGDRYLMATSSDYWFYYRNAELFALSVMINAQVECLDAEGNVVAVSNVFSNTLSSLLKTLYTTAVNANRMPMATAIADALVAGDEAVKFFTRNNTASQFVTELDSPIKDFDTSKATQTLGELNRVNVTYNGGNAPALTLGAGVAESPFLSAYFTNLPAANNINDYAVEFSYYNPITKATVVSTTNGADMSPNASKTRYYAYFRTLAIYASNADVTITVKYNGEALGTAHYSFDEFVAVNGGHPQMGAVVTALGKLGQSFRVFKGI